MKEPWDFIYLTWLVICFSLILGWTIGAAFKESVREFLSKLVVRMENLNVIIEVDGKTVRLEGKHND